MPRKARSITLNQDLPKLAELIKKAIDKNTGRTAADIADASGIARSHLSYVLKGEKSLSAEKLHRFAKETGVLEAELLQAAGYVESRSAIDRILSTIRQTESATVITDPRFLDSALFLWIFRSQRLRSLGVQWNIQPTSWDMVPIKVYGTPKSVGFYNRKSSTTFGDKVLAPNYWADLCVYEGYALLARKADVRGLSNEPSIAESIEHLKQLKNYLGRTPVIVTMADRTVRQLETPLTREVPWKDFKIERISNPDDALRLFLQGAGDLFVGGLPQRFAAEDGDECVPLISIKNDPWLFSLNSLICSEDMFTEEKGILSLITSVWFEVCHELRDENEDFRSEMYNELNEMLAKEFQIVNHYITPELLQRVFGRGTTEGLEFFPRRPAGVVSHVIEKLTACVAKCVEASFSVQQTQEAVEWISKFKIDREQADQNGVF